ARSRLLALPWRVRSIHGHAACFDRSGPLVDLALDEPAEIFRGGTLLGHDDGAECFESFAYRRRLHRLNRRVMELLDDVGRRALWKKDGVPGIGLEIGRSLLETGRHVRERGGSLLCHGHDRLHHPAVDLWLGGANNLAEVIDSAALQI